MEQEINGARSMQHAILVLTPSLHTQARANPRMMPTVNGATDEARRRHSSLTQCGTPLPSFALLFHAAQLVRHWADPPDDADESGPAAAAPQCTAVRSESKIKVASPDRRNGPRKPAPEYSHGYSRTLVPLQGTPSTHAPAPVPAQTT